MTPRGYALVIGRFLDRGDTAQASRAWRNLQRLYPRQADLVMQAVLTEAARRTTEDR